jgi:ABC-type transport system involved in multi-copper enzyme maturation permease subunit
MTAKTWLPGFAPFLGKELREWWQRRGALVTLAVMGAFGTMGTLAAKIDALAGDGQTPVPVDTTVAILGSQFQSFLMMTAIFASIGMLAQERQTGTLAWTLSKPISRRSVLLAKWVAGVVMLDVFGVILPLAWMSVLATLIYGSAPDLVIVARFAAVLLAVPALFVALNLALATRVDSQAGIAGISIALAYVPSLLGAFAPSVAALWPSAIVPIAGAIAAGQSVDVATVGSVPVGIALIGLVGLASFAREDL